MNKKFKCWTIIILFYVLVFTSVKDIYAEALSKVSSYIPAPSSFVQTQTFRNTTGQQVILSVNSDGNLSINNASGVYSTDALTYDDQNFTPSQLSITDPDAQVGIGYPLALDFASDFFVYKDTVLFAPKTGYDPLSSSAVFDQTAGCGWDLKKLSFFCFHNNIAMEAGVYGADSFTFGSDIYAQGLNSFAFGTGGLVQGDYSVILGGTANQVDGNTSGIFVGTDNIIAASSDSSAIVSAKDSTIGAAYASSILAGSNNSIGDAQNSTIVGGRGNTIGDVIGASMINAFDTTVPTGSSNLTIINSNGSSQTISGTNAAVILTPVYVNTISTTAADPDVAGFFNGELQFRMGYVRYAVGAAKAQVRTMYGLIASSGVITSGTGDFSVVHAGVGVYTINFSIAFINTPSVTATSQAGPFTNCAPTSVSGASVTIECLDIAALKNSDSSFAFQIVGDDLRIAPPI